MTTRVAIIDDNPKFLEKCVNLVAAAPEFSLFGIAVNGQSGWELLKHGQADLYLIDLDLALAGGMKLIRQVLSSYPTATVMVATVLGNEEKILESFEAGADGYLLKDDAAERILDGLRNVLKGEVWLNPMIASKILKRLRDQGPLNARRFEDGLDQPVVKNSVRQAIHLTKREVEILKVLAMGLSFVEISQSLFISTHTVAQHIKNIYRKLSVKSRGEAVYTANKLGLIN